MAIEKLNYKYSNRGNHQSGDRYLDKDTFQNMADKTDEIIDAVNKLTDYSTSETVVGNWIDGRPLYRKTIAVSLPSRTGEISFSTGLSNVTYRNIYGMIRDTNGSAYWPINLVRPSSNIGNGVGCRIDSNNIILEVGLDRSSFSGHVTVEYTKNN